MGERSICFSYFPIRVFVGVALLAGLVLVSDMRVYAQDSPALVERLLDADYRKRYEAQNELIARDDPGCIGPLAALLSGDARGNADYHVPAVLEGLSSPLALAALKNLIEHPRVYVASNAARALSTRGDRGGYAALLVRARRPGTSPADQHMVLLYSRYNFSAVEAPALRQWLQSAPGEDVTVDLCAILARLRDDAARPILETLAKPDVERAQAGSRIRAAALLALIEMGDRDRTEALLSELEARRDDLNAASFILSGIQRLNLRDAVPKLRALVTHTDSVSLKRSVLQTLLALKDYQSAPTFAKELGSDDAALSDLAFRGVVELGGEEATTLLLPYLTHAEAKKRLGAARALGELDDPRGLPVLLALLADPTMTTQALSALASVRDPDAIADVILLLNHDDENVRRVAASTLTTVINANTLYHAVDLDRDYGYRAEIGALERQAVVTALQREYPRKAAPQSE